MSVVSAPPSDKQLALEALQRLPEAATLDQMSEELALLAALRRAEAAADAGQVLSHAEVEQRSASWTSK
jgi:predicted transcriptional regulator